MNIAIINHKRYSVEHRFNMVGNWYFTDKDGNQFLIDGEDVGIWADNMGLKWDGVNTAIACARDLVATADDGCFWWKTIPAQDIKLRRSWR